MNKKFIVAIDEGTSSVRVSLYDVLKNKFTLSRRETITQYYPQPGWVEHDAEEIFQKTKMCLDDILSEIDESLVFGIGITNQRETTVCWNKKTQKPLQKAIVWQCRRTADYVSKNLTGSVAEKIHKTTGLLPDSYFSATKINWILTHNKKAPALLKSNNLCFGTIDSFLTFRLTGGKSFVTDITNASRTMLMNLKTGLWDDELLSLFGIPKSVLPQIVENDKIVGYYNFKGTDIPIAGIIGDQQSSLFGQTCFECGDIKATYGTGSFVLQNIGNKILYSKNKLITTVAWKLENQKTFYAIEGSVFNCGSAINWLKNVGIIKSPSDCDNMAETGEITKGVFFIPAFTGLGAPYWNPNAKAILCGITPGVSKNQIARAVLEGIAFRVCDVLNVIYKDTNLSFNTIKVDGGVSRSNYAMQFESNLIQKNIDISKESESTSLGAVFMCGLATKAFNSLEEIKKVYQKSKTFKPKMALSDAENLYDEYKKIIKKAF
ncbi:MAG: glycerol kinase GlpK [Clostridia bacterium]|nr:glycerol kinase GlpK [Clostridia bacterium]